MRSSPQVYPIRKRSTPASRAANTRWIPRGQHNNQPIARTRIAVLLVNQVRLVAKRPDPFDAKAVLLVTARPAGCERPAKHSHRRRRPAVPPPSSKVDRQRGNGLADIVLQLVVGLPVDTIETMSKLLEKALEKVAALPQNEQDAAASQILASLADEDAWKRRFAEKRDVIRRMAQEVLKEDERGETLPMAHLF